MSGVILRKDNYDIHLQRVDGSSATDVAALIATHAALETAHSLTANFIDAMQAASSPTTANPFITDSAADTLISAAQLISLNAQTGTTYQFVAGDYAGNVLVRCTNGSAITLTVPAHATVPNVVGVVVGLEQGGAGVVTIAAAGGVTINSLNAALSLSGQWAQAALICEAQNVWTLIGALA